MNITLTRTFTGAALALLLLTTTSITTVALFGQSTEVEGTVSNGSAPGSQKPVIVGGWDNTNAIRLRLTNQGMIPLGFAGNGQDGLTNSQVLYGKDVTDTSGWLLTAPLVFNGSTWDRLRGSLKGLGVQGYSGAAGGSMQPLTVCEYTSNIYIAQNNIVQVSGVTNAKIHVCAISLSTVDAAAHLVYFWSGSATNCSAGAAIGSMWVGPTAPMTWGSGLGNLINTRATGDHLCVSASAGGTSGVQGTMTYAIY
jgi:hypothetical protein